MDKHPVEITLQPAVPGAMADRRQSDRHITLLRVGSLMVCGRRELCLIRNISDGGMLIRVYSDIPVGSRVSIELKHGEAVWGTTLWTKRDLVGVSFDDPINMMSLITTPPNSLRPRMPRLEVGCTVWIREGSVVHRSRTANISQGGLRVETPDGLPVGAQVTVTLPGLPPEQGIVRWIVGEACGVTFNRLLALPQLVAWIGEQQERQRTRSGYLRLISSNQRRS